MNTWNIYPVLQVLFLTNCSESILNDLQNYIYLLGLKMTLPHPQSPTVSELSSDFTHDNEKDSTIIIAVVAVIMVVFHLAIYAFLYRYK